MLPDVRSVVIDDGNLQLRERPTPEPGPGDVLVQVAAAGVNAADLLQRRGLYPPPPGAPADVPGLELAGVVIARGDGVDVGWDGRRVCAIVGGGGQSTHAVVPAEHLIPVPTSAGWDEAGGFAEAFLTAHDALVSQARVASGEHVVVSGAAGGVGSAAIQIAHRLGAHVSAVTRGREHHGALLSLGADRALTVDDVDSLSAVDVVLELVGPIHLERVMPRLAPRARVVVIGIGSGAEARVDLRRVMAQRLTITGSTLRARPREEKAVVTARATADLWEAWNAGAIHVPVESRFSLDDVTEAYEAFARPGKFGKVILRAGPGPR